MERLCTNDSSPGNNENESEKQRILRQNKKNFMSPTISASAKFNSSPNKKMFGGWKSARSDPCKLGNSNSGSRKSLPKIPLISPKNVLHSHNNKENESENQRNLQQKNKNFMLPTMSDSSKFNSSRNKIFGECKSARSDLCKLGNSNSCSRKSLPKILPSSPKNVAHPHKNNAELEHDDGVSVVLDCFDVPNDPLTNQMCPRPKFLRRRLNGRLEILVRRDEKSETYSDSDNDCCLDSLSKQDSEEIVISDEQVVVHDEEDEDLNDFEEENCGFKWESMKFLILFCSLFFCTICICFTNSSSFGAEHQFKGVKIEYKQFVNMSLRIVSFRSVDAGIWILDGKNSSNSGLEFDEHFSKIDDQVSEIVEVHEINVLKRIKFLEDSYQIQRLEDEFGVTNVTLEINGGPGSESFSGMMLGSVVENAAGVADKAIEKKSGVDFDKGKEDSEEKAKGHVDFDETNVGHEIADAKMDYYQAQIEAQMAASELSEAPDVEVPNVGGEESWIADARIKYFHAETEAQMVASELSETPDVEVLVGLPSFESKTDDSEAKYSDAEIGSENSDQAIEEEIQIDFDKGMEDIEVKSKEGRKVNEVEGVAKDGYKVGNTFSELIWPVISPLVAFSLFASLVWSFYRKCKRAYFRTRSSNVKLCSNVGTDLKTSLGLPPKSVERTDKYHQLNAPFFRKFDQSEVNPASIDNPMENIERDVHTVIPTVKQLGDFEVGVEFTQSLKATPDVKGGTRRSSFSVRASTAKTSNSELSTAESCSCCSYISQDTTAMKDGREEVTSPTLRRSARLKNKGVTSPVTVLWVCSLCDRTRPPIS